MQYIYESKLKRKYKITISDTVFLEFVTSRFNSGAKLESLPYLIHEASIGNFQPNNRSKYFLFAKTYAPSFVTILS